MKRKLISGVAGVLCLLGVSSVSAQVAKEGKYDNQGCYIGPHYVIAHSKDQMAGSYAAYGVNLGSPGQLFHNASGACYGSWTLINGEFNDSGACEVTDPDGDKFLGLYSRKNQENGSWRVTGGTGKYNGMVNTGYFIPLTQAPQPAGQVAVCNRQVGSWKLR